MGDATLFVSEILKGLTTGFNQGMALRQKDTKTKQDAMFKKKELEIKEKSLMDRTAMDEMNMAIKKLDVENDYLIARQKNSLGAEKLEYDRGIAENKRLTEELKMKMQGKFHDDEMKHKENVLKVKQSEGKLDREAKAKAATAKGMKRIPVGMLGAIKDGKRMPGLLTTLGTMMAPRKGDFGPGEGRLRTWNPWDTEAQDFKSQSSLVAETLTKYLQGSRPSDYDAKRYAKLVPRLQDKYEVAQRKYKRLIQAFAYEERVTYELLKGQGYDMGGMSMPKDVRDPITKRYASAYGKGKSNKSLPEPKLGSIINRNGKKYRIIRKNGVVGAVPVK